MSNVEDAWPTWFAGLASSLRLREPGKPNQYQLPTYIDINTPDQNSTIVKNWPDYSAGYYGLEWS